MPRHVGQLQCTRLPCQVRLYLVGLWGRGEEGSRQATVPEEGSPARQQWLRAPNAAPQGTPDHPFSPEDRGPVWSGHLLPCFRRLRFLSGWDAGQRPGPTPPPSVALGCISLLCVLISRPHHSKPRGVCHWLQLMNIYKMAFATA